MRLIDADLFRQQNEYFWNKEFDDPKYQETLGELIDAAPTVDAVPVVHARWEQIEENKFPRFFQRCSACMKLGDFSSPYCPNCGAKMDLDASPE